MGAYGADDNLVANGCCTPPEETPRRGIGTQERLQELALLVE